MFPIQNEKKIKYEYIEGGLGNQWLRMMGVDSFLECSVGVFPFMLMLISFLIFGYFYALSIETADRMWFARSGALVSLLSVLLEMYIVRRITRYIDHYKSIKESIKGRDNRLSLDPYVKTIEHAIHYTGVRRRLGHKIIISMAVLGTLVWAFGDLLVPPEEYFDVIENN